MIMCCIDMYAGKPLTKERFLKTIQKKITQNKKRAEPSMRIEALLESTCQRLREEFKTQRKRDYLDPLDESSSNSKKQKTEELYSDSMDQEIEEEIDIFSDEFMEDEKDNSKQLWDDPQQVEDFLIQVTNNNVVSPLHKEIEIEDFNDNDFYSTYDNTESESISTLVTTYDVSSFTLEFDNLFKELVQNLVTVETYLSSTTSSSSKACS